MRVVVAFLILGLLNNVQYVILLAAAQDLVGLLPKGIVLVSSVVPSLLTKLIALCFFEHLPYETRIILFCVLATIGMLLVALTPPFENIILKMVGVALASLSSGGGETTFLGLTHLYGPDGLLGWGSGTGIAGLVGAGLYVLFTQWWQQSVRVTLLFSSTFSTIMLLSFFFILPKGPLKERSRFKDYESVLTSDPDAVPQPARVAATPTTALIRSENSSSEPSPSSWMSQINSTIYLTLLRAKPLVIPYMMPMLLVYAGQYTINQGVAPTLLFPLEQSPVKEFREFYPIYSFLNQLGIFISRCCSPFFRIPQLYVLVVLQFANLAFLILQAYFFFIPSVYIIFILIFLDGFLGGSGYINCLSEIMDNVQEEDREFSMSAASLSDSIGIITAGLVSISLEPLLCNYQTTHGRDWCKKIRS